MPRRSHDVGAEDDATEGANAPGWQAVKSEHIGNLRSMDDWANYLALSNDEGFGGHSKSWSVVVLEGGCKH